MRIVQLDVSKNKVDNLTKALKVFAQRTGQGNMEILKNRCQEHPRVCVCVITHRLFRTKFCSNNPKTKDNTRARA